jgi:CBS-domain-containing membrane protein
MTSAGKRKRRMPTPGDFEDPLQNYDPKEFDDGLEQALCELPVSACGITPYTTYPKSLTVDEALAVMSENDYYCLMVADEEGMLLGVFTERDVLKRVAETYDEVRSQPIGDLMTTDVRIVYETDPLGKALNLMAVGGFRHVPVLGVDDKVVGIVGPTRLVRFLYEHLDDAIHAD